MQQDLTNLHGLTDQIKSLGMSTKVILLILMLSDVKNRAESSDAGEPVTLTTHDEAIVTAAILFTKITRLKNQLNLTLIGQTPDELSDRIKHYINELAKIKNYVSLSNTFAKDLAPLQEDVTKTTTERKALQEKNEQLILRSNHLLDEFVNSEVTAEELTTTLHTLLKDEELLHKNAAHTLKHMNNLIHSLTILANKTDSTAGVAGIPSVTPAMDIEHKP